MANGSCQYDAGGDCDDMKQLASISALGRINAQRLVHIQKATVAAALIQMIQIQNIKARMF